jgi:hypothetical protein
MNDLMLSAVWIEVQPLIGSTHVIRHLDGFEGRKQPLLIRNVSLGRCFDRQAPVNGRNLIAPLVLFNVSVRESPTANNTAGPIRSKWIIRIRPA